MNASRVHLERVGLSLRRVQYWTEQGWLLAVDGTRGSGYALEWPPCEVLVAAYMMRLVEAGVSPPAAARAARAGGVIAPGVRVVITWSDESWAAVAALYGELVSTAPPVGWPA